MSETKAGISSTDPRVIDVATPKQLEYLRAYEDYGSFSAAADVLGVHKSAVGRSVTALKKKLAVEHGYAPEQGFDEPIPPGFMMDRYTEQVGPQGRERIWVKGKRDPLQYEAMLRDMLTGLLAEIPPLPVTPAPKDLDADLLNLYTFTDYHLGMLAWHEEGGEDWDLGIATSLIMASFQEMLRRQPRAKKCVINIQGDFLHTDGLLPVTPTNHHVLDADTRFRKIAMAAMMILRHLVDMALDKHEQVELLICEGNHDEGSSLWMQLAFGMHYSEHPRVTVHKQALPYYAIQHGKTMLAFHHGHKKKNDDLPLLFATQFPVMWGETTRRYCNTGHRHHLEMKEHAGMTVMQHPTLSARDAHCARGGWFSERAAVGIAFHREFGRYTDDWVTPEMVQATVKDIGPEWPLN